MSRATVILDSKARREQAAKWVWNAPAGTRLTFQEAKRTNDQSALMWSLLTDIARQKRWHGVRLSAEDFKLIFMASLNQEMRLVPNLDGTGFVNLGTSSSKLSKGEMANLIELILAWGAQNDVNFFGDEKEKPLLVCGGRDFQDRKWLFDVLNAAWLDAEFTEIICGYNPEDTRYQGADQLAWEWTEAVGAPCRVFPADWAKFGRGAGPRRNTQMANEKPSACLAFPRANGEWGAGTMDMVRKCQERGIPVRKAEPIIDGRDSGSVNSRPEVAEKEVA